MHLSHVVGLGKAVLGLELVVKWVSGWRWMGKGEEEVPYCAVKAYSIPQKTHIYSVYCDPPSVTSLYPVCDSFITLQHSSHDLYSPNLLKIK